VNALTVFPHAGSVRYATRRLSHALLTIVRMGKTASSVVPSESAWQVHVMAVYCWIQGSHILWNGRHCISRN
jgi:hypothetical protein